MPPPWGCNKKALLGGQVAVVFATQNPLKSHPTEVATAREPDIFGHGNPHFHVGVNGFCWGRRGTWVWAAGLGGAEGRGRALPEAWAVGACSGLTWRLGRRLRSWFARCLTWCWMLQFLSLPGPYLLSRRPLTD